MMQTRSRTRTAPDASVTHRVHEACHAIGQFVDYWGFKGLHGRVWALLAMHRHPITQARVAKELGVSRASVSAAIAELTRYNLVQAVGDRRHAPYVAVMDVWPTIADVLRQREWKLVEVARGALSAALEEVERAGDAATDYSSERLRVLLTMTGLAQSLLKLLVTLRAPTPTTLTDLRRWGGRAAAFVQGVRERMRN